jgi:hypothetical protein
MLLKEERIDKIGNISAPANNPKKDQQSTAYLAIN